LLHRPDLVRCTRQIQTFPLHRDAVATPPSLYHQASSSIQAVNPLVVDLHASTPQPNVQAAIAKAPTLLSQLHQLGLQISILRVISRLVAQHRAGQPDQLTGTALGDAGLRLHTSLTIDVDRDLRLVYYAAREGQAQSRLFEQWLQAEAKQQAGAAAAALS
jgi:hypothetical protein